MQDRTDTREAPSAGDVPRGVVALGLVSLFMDISSELVHSLLPALFLALGIPMQSVGLIEGVAEASAAVTKVFSGALSDRLGKRKLLAVVGYGLAALTKPLFPLAHSAGTILAARFIDRIGKGIRGAPRDALIADLTPAARRGAAYGLRQSLDTIGAVAGPLAAFALMYLLADDVTQALWFALPPALASVALLVWLVKEPASTAAANDNRRTGPLLARIDIAALGRSFWLVTGIGGVFTLARFSEAFLTLRAIDLGLPLAWSPLVLMLMSLVYSLSSYPAGVLADRMPRDRLLALGLVALVAADLLLTQPGLAAAIAGIALWGLHMGLTQGLLSALVADSAPARLRGTAFGVFNLVSGVALLLASAVAGLVWQAAGAPATFGLGALFASLALVLLALTRRFRDGSRAAT
jgi:MFS family permease